MRGFLLASLVLAACGDDATPTIDAPVTTPDGAVATPDAPTPTPDAPVPTPDAPIPTPDAMPFMAPLVIDTDLNFPIDLRVDADAVYWTESAANSGTASGQIKRFDRGTGVITVLADMQDYPQGIAVDDTHVYWANSGYFADDSGIRRVPKTGGAVQTVSTTPNAFFVVLDDTHVYWNSFGDTGAGAIVKRVKTLAMPETPVVADAWIAGLHLTDTLIYYTTAGNPDSMTATGTVKSVPKIGGATTGYASAQALPLTLYLDGTTLFWTNRGSFATPNSGSIMSLDIGTPGAVPVALATMQAFPSFLVVDATHVTFTNFGTPDDLTTTGSLARVPRAGGTVEILEPNLNHPLGLVAGDTDFWFTVGGAFMIPTGEIRRRPY